MESETLDDIFPNSKGKTENDGLQCFLSLAGKISNGNEFNTEAFDSALSSLNNSIDAESLSQIRSQFTNIAIIILFAIIFPILLLIFATLCIATYSGLISCITILILFIFFVIILTISLYFAKCYTFNSLSTVTTKFKEIVPTIPSAIKDSVCMYNRIDDTTQKSHID